MEYETLIKFILLAVLVGLVIFVAFFIIKVHGESVINTILYLSGKG